MKRIILVFLAAILVLGMAGLARAAGVGNPITINNVPNIVGVAVGRAPDYQGSNDYRFVGAPFFKFTFSGRRYVQFIGTELSANLLNDPVLRFGPSLNYRPGRSDSVDDSVVSKMQKIDATAEAGAFIGAEFINSSNPRQRFITNLDFLDDVGNTNKGYNITLSARYWYPLFLPLDVSIGASTTYASSNYMQTYFGVTPSNVGSSGLPLYNASSGIKDVTVSPALVFHMSMSWHIGVGFRYQRLLNDAKNSPVVKDRGSADQWIYGLAVAYTW